MLKDQDMRHLLLFWNFNIVYISAKNWAFKLSAEDRLITDNCGQVQLIIS